MNEVLSRRFGERAKAYKKSPHMIVQGADTPPFASRVVTLAAPFTALGHRLVHFNPTTSIESNQNKNFLLAWLALKF